MKQFWSVVTMLLMVTFASCGGGKSDLVGRWYKIEGSGSSIPQEIELLKDGTGFALDQAITWKTENKRLYITHPFIAMAFDYKITGSKIELSNNDGEKFAYVKKLGGASALVGTWEQVLGGDNVSVPEGFKVIHLFNKDGTWEITVYENEKTHENKGKWVAEKDVLYNWVDKGRVGKSTFEIKGKTLKIKDRVNDADRIVEFKKQ